MHTTGSPQAPLSRRDDGEQAEYVQIELDTYFDRRTAYMFGVTASGVRLDHFHPSDNEDDTDAQFDPVWEAKAAKDDRGWTAELWLPFSQLRFNDQPERVWGLNVKRWRPDLNEEDYWVVIGRTERGWSSRFGELRGIEGVTPRERLEVLPYVASSSRASGNRDLRNPFDSAANLGGRMGADVKVGLGSNLTLEATINPDFGQIEADPAEVNLTVFETIFDERRPFFIEGNDLLTGRGASFLGRPTWFYSRRIGATPPGIATGAFVKQPQNTTIISAAKITGRLPSRLTVGLLAAATPREYAQVYNAGPDGIASIAVGAPSQFGVLRLQQEFGTKQSNVGFSLTGMRRDLDARKALVCTLLSDRDLAYLKISAVG